MMISPAYCRTMAGYSRWQNDQLAAAFAALDPAALLADRGAFFGSILGTANHVLWADQLWLARLTGTGAPALSLSQSPGLTDSGSAWQAARRQCDDAMSAWARDLDEAALAGDLSWHSDLLGAPMSRPLALCAMHLFTHGTHHRGQIHAMLTAAGADAPTTGLLFAPDRDAMPASA